MSRARGTSLLELIVSFGMISLALATVLGLVGLVNRWFRMTSARNLAQQQLLSVGSRLSQDLRQSQSRALTAYYPSGNPAQGDLVLGFPSAYDGGGNYQTDPYTGVPNFQTYELVYRNSNDNTVRLLRTAPSSIFPTLSPAPPLPADMSAAILAGSGQVLSRYVDKLAVVDSNNNPTNNLSNPVNLWIHVDCQVEGSQQHSLMEAVYAIRLPR